MRKVSVFLLASVMAIPAMANDYGEYDTFDYDESYTTYAPDYDAPTSRATRERARDTYAGVRIHRNEHIAFHYDIHDAKDTTITNDNFGFGLNIGNRLTENVKIEFETLYTGTSETKRATDFDYDIWSNMLNVYIYKNFGGAVEPYFGLGIGVGGIWGNVSGAMGHYDDCGFDLSFAAMAGVNFALNKYVDLNLGLRYVGYGRVKHNAATTRVDGTDIYIGAAYKFGLFNK